MSSADECRRVLAAGSDRDALGLGDAWTPEELKSAWRRLCLRTHPDQAARRHSAEGAPFDAELHNRAFARARGALANLRRAAAKMVAGSTKSQFEYNWGDWDLSPSGGVERAPSRRTRAAVGAVFASGFIDELVEKTMGRAAREWLNTGDRKPRVATVLGSLAERMARRLAREK